MRGFTSRAIPNLVVFLSGLAIMVLELVASRLVANHLGSSLETWTTVIGVILAGMSLGNYWGGRLSDERPPLQLLPYLFGAAALFCVSVLWTNEVVGSSSLMAMLPRLVRIVATIGIIFFPAACLLGFIPPVVARWALEESIHAGSAIGNVYAWGTAGNIVGTLVTGFVLLASLGVHSIIWISAGVLAIVAVGLLALARHPRPSPLPSRPLPGRRGASPPPAPEGREFWAGALPNAFVFVSGMSIMMVELVGSRLVSRHMGTSIYTWTSLIGVILAGVSVGNYIGGKLADRFSPARTLPHLFLIASLLVVILPRFQEWLGPIDRASALRWLDGFSIPQRIFAKVALVFLAPALALGTISPVTAKLALERARRAGRAIGNVYAWGAIGSIAGTFLTGYLLISLVGSLAVLCLVAGLLALLALYDPADAEERARALPSSEAARPPNPWRGLPHAVWAGVIAAVCIVALAPETRRWEWATRIGDLVHVRETHPGIYFRESNYYTIKVQDTEDEGKELVLDNLIHGYVIQGQPRALRYDYEQIYAAVLERAGAPPMPDDDEPDNPPATRPLRTLFIGGGSYTFPRYIEAAYPGSTIVVAEIDPAVTRTAHEALYLPRSTPIETRWGDARTTIDRMLSPRLGGSAIEAPYDFIFGDAFNDFSVPWHLTTLEFNEKIAQLLAPNGVYMINIIDNYEYSKFLAAYVQTARKTFRSVEVFSTHPDGPTDSRETFVIAMSQQPLDLANFGARPNEKRGVYLPNSFYPDMAIGSVLSLEELDVAIGRGGPALLTDDYAPVENFLADVVKDRGN